MIDYKDFRTSEWVGCGGYHLIKFITDILNSISTVPRNHIVDMGAGCGVIGICLSEMGLTNELTLLDIDQESVNLCKINKEIFIPNKNVHIFQSNAWNTEQKKFYDLVTSKVDTVICNSPLSNEIFPVPKNQNPFRYLSLYWSFQKNLLNVEDLDKIMSKNGIIILKDRYNSSWSKNIKGLKLVDTIIPDTKIFDTATEIFTETGYVKNLEKPPIKQHFHCLRIFIKE